MGVERTEDDVALGGLGIARKLRDVVVDGYVPGVHIDVVSGALQAVAAHEQATVILRHAAAIAVDVVQGEHHTHTQGGGSGLLHGLGHGSGLGRWCDGRFGGVGNEDAVAFLQRVVGRLHLGIGGAQLVFGQAKFLGNAIHRVFLLHLIQVAPLGHLGRHC